MIRRRVWQRSDSRPQHNTAVMWVLLIILNIYLLTYLQNKRRRVVLFVTYSLLSLNISINYFQREKNIKMRNILRYFLSQNPLPDVMTRFSSRSKPKHLLAARSCELYVGVVFYIKTAYLHVTEEAWALRGPGGFQPPQVCSRDAQVRF